MEIASRQLLNRDGQTSESPVTLTEYHSCDEKRRESEWGELLNGEPDTKTISRYDARGNEIEHEYWIQGSLRSRTVSRYDASDRLVEIIYEDGSKVKCVNVKSKSTCRTVDRTDTLKNRWVTRRDSFGREIERVVFESGRSPNRYVYRYDKQGNRILEAHYYQDEGKERSSRKFFTFDDQGKLLEKLWYDDKGLRTREVYEYNNRQDLTRRTEYDGNKRVVEQMTLRYESYDSKGRWTKALETRIRSIKGKTTLDIRRVLYRTITYFSSVAAPV